MFQVVLLKVLLDNSAIAAESFENICSKVDLF